MGKTNIGKKTSASNPVCNAHCACKDIISTQKMIALLTTGVTRDLCLVQCPHCFRFGGQLRNSNSLSYSRLQTNTNLAQIIHIAPHPATRLTPANEWDAFASYTPIGQCWAVCSGKPLKLVLSALLTTVPHKCAMAQQQLTKQFDDQILQDLGCDMIEDCESSTSKSCTSCQRMFCICDRNTESEITITSEDSIKNRQDCHLSGSDGEEEFEGKSRGWNSSNNNQHLDELLTADISWEDWGKAERECGRASSFARGSAGGDADHNNGVQSPLGLPYQRQSFVRPIMLQPPNMFDSDLRVFLIRSLQDVRLYAGSETMIKTDIEFHPFLTEQGVKTVQSWAATVTPLAPASPYFSEIFTYCMVKGGTVELCLQAQKLLTVTIINGSSSRDAIIHAGSVIAVLEICAHRY